MFKIWGLSNGGVASQKQTEAWTTEQCSLVQNLASSNNKSRTTDFYEIPVTVKL